MTLPYNYYYVISDITLHITNHILHAKYYRC